MKCKICKTPLGDFSTIMTSTINGEMKPLRLYYCRTCRKQIRVEYGLSPAINEA